MQWLADHGYRVAHLGQEPLHPKTIGIMFDDGYLDTYTHAWPILREYGFTATVFLITSLVGDTVRWTQQGRAAQLMTWEQAKEMVEGGIQFGSHSHTHSDLTSLSKQQLDDELQISREAIKSQLHIEVDLFSYPCSRTNRIVAQRVSASGYRHAFRFSPFFPGTRRRGHGDLPATGILGHDDVEQFQHKVRGSCSRWLSWRARQIKTLARQRRLPEC
jgi:peptidoglycan/xylan/chitin deacetylase (PgdA/CDA1 family)